MFVKCISLVNKYRNIKRNSNIFFKIFFNLQIHVIQYNYNMYEHSDFLIVVMPKQKININSEFSPVDFTASFYAFLGIDYV